MSNTVGFAEVKVFGVYLLGSGNLPANDPPPTSPAALVGMGGSLKTLVTHTGWTEGQTFQTGVTFVFPPNTQVPFTSGGVTYDVDYVSSRDGSSATNLSYAAMTSRSFHTGVSSTPCSWTGRCGRYRKASHKRPGGRRAPGTVARPSGWIERLAPQGCPGRSPAGLKVATNFSHRVSVSALLSRCG